MNPKIRVKNNKPTRAAILTWSKYSIVIKCRFAINEVYYLTGIWQTSWSLETDKRSFTEQQNLLLLLFGKYFSYGGREGQNAHSQKQINEKKTKKQLDSENRPSLLYYV